MVRVKIDRQEVEMFIIWLQNSIANNAKTVDGMKEYLLAQIIYGVLCKCKMIQLKYTLTPSYKKSSVALNEIEMTALNCYFRRYQVPSYLMPLERDILECMRCHYPKMIDIITNNNIQWQTFLEK